MIKNMTLVSENTMGKLVLTQHKIYNIDGMRAIRDRTEFLYSFKRPCIHTANDIEAVVGYCVTNNIDIYALESNGNLTHLTSTPFYELPLKRAVRLLMWKGKDLVCAYEFEREDKQ